MGSGGRSAAGALNLATMASRVARIAEWPLQAIITQLRYWGKRTYQVQWPPRVSAHRHLQWACRGASAGIDHVRDVEEACDKADEPRRRERLDEHHT